MSKLASLFIEKKDESHELDHQNLTSQHEPDYKILFVDDDENVLKAMRRIFARENYAILTASSGFEALALLEEEPVNVVIADHRMPKMTGADLLRQIKAKFPKTIRIMLSGHADVGAIMGAVNEGAVYKFITKPWNDDDLRLSVSLALEQYDLIRENESLKTQRDAQEKKIKQLSRFINTQRSQLGQILLRKNLIPKKDLDKALAQQTKNNKILPSILIKMGIMDEETIMKVIQTELGINRVYPNEFTIIKDLILLIPKEICERNLLVPLKRVDGRLIVAMADPTDYMKIDDLQFITGLPVQPVLSTEKEIMDKLKEVYGDNKSLKDVMSEIDMTDPIETIEIILDEEDEETDIDDLLRAKDQPPAIRIVNAIIAEALRFNASDVHIEPKSKYVMVRYRVDGLLRDKIHIPLSIHTSIVSRIKVMCEMDIAERRKPQDGRVTVKTPSKMVDMRISTLPTISGEKVVLRILDKSAPIKDSAELGLAGKDIVKLVRLVSQPQGIILSTGPTGSGKTTTLYSLLQQVVTPTKNYTTIEDPVEYYMSMAEQVLVREKIGLRFSVILRALLRQDPDVIMLGEIRDFETAEVAFHAAMTGHLVLSTLHTNSAAASITRLVDLGLNPHVINEALIGIVAQRLLRRICSHCKIDDTPSEEQMRALKLDKGLLDFTPKKGAGCERCNHSGYSGRTGIFEVFQMDEELKKMICQNARETELVRVARWSGMTTLLENAINKIKEGMTSVEEVLNTLGPQNTLEIPCPHCNTLLEERFQFCPFCSNAIIPRCDHCSKFLMESWKVCPYCGEKPSNTTSTYGLPDKTQQKKKGS